MLDPNSWKVWGPLGFYALLATLSTIKLYLDARADRRAQAAQLEKERVAFEEERRKRGDELRQLEERYVTKAETWMNQYAEFSRAATQVVDAVTRRYGRDRGGSP